MTESFQIGGDVALTQEFSTPVAAVEPLQEKEQQPQSAQEKPSYFAGWMMVVLFLLGCVLAEGYKFWVENGSSAEAAELHKYRVEIVWPDGKRCAITDKFCMKAQWPDGGELHIADDRSGLKVPIQVQDDPNKFVGPPLPKQYQYRKK